MSADDQTDMEALAARITALEQELEHLQHLTVLDKSVPPFIAGEAFQRAQRPRPPAREETIAAALDRLAAAMADLTRAIEARRSDTTR